MDALLTILLVAVTVPVVIMSTSFVMLFVTSLIDGMRKRTPLDTLRKRNDTEPR